MYASINLLPLATYAKAVSQLIHLLAILITFPYYISAAHAEISIDKLEGPVTITNYRTRWRGRPVNEVNFLDPDFAKWAWRNISSEEALDAELAKYNGAYKDWEKLARKVRSKVPFKDWAYSNTPEYLAKQDAAERAFLKQSENSEAIARARDLHLLGDTWFIAFGRSIPPYADDRKAFETYYCEKYKTRFTFLMDGCNIPTWENWAITDAKGWGKVNYDRKRLICGLVCINKNKNRTLHNELFSTGWDLLLERIKITISTPKRCAIRLFSRNLTPVYQRILIQSLYATLTIIHHLQCRELLSVGLEQLRLR